HCLLFVREYKPHRICRLRKKRVPTSEVAGTRLSTESCALTAGRARLIVQDRATDWSASGRPAVAALKRRRTQMAGHRMVLHPRFGGGLMGVGAGCRTHRTAA